MALGGCPELWPQRAPQSLMWPLSRMMVAEPCRLLYMPIPGAADAAIQRVMLELSRIPHREALLALGIDGVVEQFCTGLMLADRSAAEIQAIGASTAYFRFAIVYEPVARLVDIYQQRFVELREMLPGGPGFTNWRWQPSAAPRPTPVPARSPTSTMILTRTTPSISTWGSPFASLSGPLSAVSMTTRCGAVRLTTSPGPTPTAGFTARTS